MQCTVCGTELERAGQGHTCRPAQPMAITPPAGLTVLYIVMALVSGTVAYSLPASGPIPSGQAARVLVVSAVWLVVLVGTVVAQIVWNRNTRALAERYGFDGKLVVRTLFLRVYS